jgi:phosphoglycerate kinase
MLPMCTPGHSQCNSDQAAVPPSQVLLLENTRFHSGDVSNDPGFAAALASLADVYVCDAFGVMHRDQASVTVSLFSPSVSHADLWSAAVETCADTFLR